jgi:3-dehydroquinate synthetase
MGRDKKAVAGKLRFILLEALGRARVVSDVSDADVTAVLS